MSFEWCSRSELRVVKSDLPIVMLMGDDDYDDDDAKRRCV